FSQIVGHGNQGKFCGYLFKTSKMEAAEAHISFYVTKTTFYFNTSSFPELEAFLRVKVCPGLLLVVIKFFVDLDRPVGSLLGFATTLIKRATAATAAFVFFDL
uniref:hypothetical protein n=1 Tax=Dyadobacter sp. OTU695 TaxID=3043860 RepID=UPI00313C4F73